jgi:DNA repair exonuclease SbcCD nuclease subunit
VTRPSTTVRLLHTSDVHVTGDDRPQVALRQVVDTALARDVDIVLIAGDLFDNARVGQPVVDQTMDELSRLTMPVVVVPGNHDCLGTGSIYGRVDFGRVGKGAVFAGDPTGEEFRFADLSLGIWARGIEDHSPAHRPLHGHVAAGAGWWNVVVTHGHYVRDDEVSDRSSPILQREIGELECDYVALGHWHRFLDVSEGGVTAFYSGSPSEPIGPPPTVNLVTLDPVAGVTVDRIPISPE